MDDFNKEQIRQWTLSKIESNPKLFGGDEGNPSIIKAYLFDIHSIDISLDTARCISTASRDKNHILESNPQYDYRVKFKRKGGE